MAVHNPSALRYEQLVRIQLPNNDYSAEYYNHSSGRFLKCNYDIVPQRHFLNNGINFTDYMLFMPYTLETNQIGYVRISKGAQQIDFDSVIDEKILIS